MQQQQQTSGDHVPSAEPSLPVSTPAVQLGLPPSAVPQAHQAPRQPQMPAYPHDVTQARPQQLGWDSQPGNYMSVNVTVNLPTLGPYVQQTPAQTPQLVPAMIQPQQRLQPASMQPQQLLQQPWRTGSPGPQLQPQLVGQHTQIPVSQTSYSVMPTVDYRQEQLPFWQQFAVARAGVTGAGHATAGMHPGPYAQLQQAAAGTALMQQAAPIVASPAMQIQLQNHVLQAAPQQVQLQEIPAYALVYLPPQAGAEAEQQQLHAQADGLQPLVLHQQGQQLIGAPQQQHRKTRRGPNRGRSKQKKAQQQAEAEAAAVMGAPETTAMLSSWQQPNQAILHDTDQQHGETKYTRVTSGSSTSYTSATTTGTSSGSGLLGSQGGADTAAEDRGTTGSPQKKRIRRRGRRGKKGSGQELQGAEGSLGGQREIQTLAEPLTPAPVGSTGGSKTSSGSQLQARASPSSPSPAAAAVGATSAQSAKRTTGLSHRQRYRRKQWELHRAMEQQRAQAEAEATQQAEAQALLAAAQAQLATPQQLPVLWQELQGAAVMTGGISPQQQLQCSPMTIVQQVHGSPMDTVGVAASVVLQAELQQRANMLATAAAVANRASVSEAGAGEATAGGRASAGAGVEVSLGPGASHEGQAGEGLGHVDHNLDEWLSKLLEL